MKIYPDMHELYTMYVEGTWLAGVAHIPNKLATLLSRIKAVVQAWCNSGTESPEEFDQKFIEDSKRVRTRIRHLQLKFNTVQAFIDKRPDLKNLMQAALDEEDVCQPEIELPKSTTNDVAIGTWGKLLKEEYALECLWEDLVDVVKNNKRVNKCFFNHIQKIERAETISDADRKMLRLLYEKPQNAKPGFHQSLGLMVTGLGSPAPSSKTISCR